jgi:hypothetical protein
MCSNGIPVRCTLICKSFRRTTNILGALHPGISGSNWKKQRRTKSGRKMRCLKAPNGGANICRKNLIKPYAGAAHRNINPALTNLSIMQILQNKLDERLEGNPPDTPSLTDIISS